MNIVDPELRQRVERVLASGAVTRPILALMDAYDHFQRSAGEDSVPAKEAVQLLLSPELRPALRQWYEGVAGPLNPVAEDFRQQLSALAAEPFGSPHPAA